MSVLAGLGKFFGGKAAGGVGKLAISLRQAIKGKELDPNEVLAVVKIQGEINKLEAAHHSLYVAGWRPSIGYICGIALLFNYVLRPLLNWVLLLIPREIPALPSMDMGELTPILMGLLGLGVMRTVEKLKKRDK